MHKLLIIGFVWPEPKSSAAGSRILQLINVFKELAYEIVFASACEKTSNAFDLSTIDVSTKSIKLNDSSFDIFIKDLNPKLVLFDRFMIEEQFGWRVTQNCPDAIKILDTEDLHCLRKGRHQALIDDHVFDDTYLFNIIAKREIASIYRCDLTLLISAYELELLKNRFKVPEDIMSYVPFLLQNISKKQTENLTSFNKRKDFITIGNFMHKPNFDALLFLKESIWPQIKKRKPNAIINIYGAYQSPKVTQLHNEKEGFIIKGYADDVHSVMQNSRVCLAPLRFGAGLKGKLVDAMRNGTPCVMTTIAAEGMFGKYNANGFIVDQESEFAEKAIQLYNEERVWIAFQKNGFKVINQRFNGELQSLVMKQKVSDLKTNLKKHRQNNFVGALLNYHSMQSTKFMSRWIEEKNKNN